MPVIFTKKLHQWIWHDQLYTDFCFLITLHIHSYELLFTVSFYFFLIYRNHLSSFQFGSVAQLCLTLCDPMDRSRLGFPAHQQLPQLAQTHVHWVGDAIQPSNPVSSPSPPALNLSQHQGLFKWVSSSHRVAKVLEFQVQHQSSQWMFRTDLLKDRLAGFPCSPRDSQESSPTPQFKNHQFLGAQLPL